MGRIDEGALLRLKEIGGDELVARMVDAFVSYTPARAEAARQGAAAGDLHAVERAAHSLKSSAGNVGATRLLAICTDVERRAGLGLDDGLDGLLEDMAAELEAVTCALRSVRDRPA